MLQSALSGGPSSQPLSGCGSVALHTKIKFLTPPLTWAPAGRMASISLRKPHLRGFSPAQATQRLAFAHTPSFLHKSKAQVRMTMTSLDCISIPFCRPPLPVHISALPHQRLFILQVHLTSSESVREGFHSLSLFQDSFLFLAVCLYVDTCT